MNNYKSITMLALLLMFGSLLAIAADNTYVSPAKDSITLDQPLNIGSVQLKPGTYTLRWDQNSQTPQVDFYRGDTKVASVTAKMEKKEHNGSATFGYNTANGTPQLNRVYTRHVTLVFNSASANSGS